MLEGLIPSRVGGVVAASTWAFFCAPQCRNYNFARA